MKFHIKIKILQKLASRNNNGGCFGSQALTEHSSTCDTNTQQELGKSSYSPPANWDQAENNSNTQNRVLAHQTSGHIHFGSLQRLKDLLQFSNVKGTL